MSHILIDAATGSPVPLPYYGESLRLQLPVAVYDFHPKRGVWATFNNYKSYYVPGIFGLAIITEEEFMARQQPSVFVDGYLKGTE